MRWKWFPPLIPCLTTGLAGNRNLCRHRDLQKFCVLSSLLLFVDPFQQPVWTIASKSVPGKPLISILLLGLQCTSKALVFYSCDSDEILFGKTLQVILIYFPSAFVLITPLNCARISNMNIYFDFSTLHYLLHWWILL